MSSLTKIKRSIKLLGIPEEKTFKYYFVNIWYILVDAFFHSWWSPLRNFGMNCQRVFKWLPIIWEDREWDYVYILRIWRHRLRFQREHLQKYGIHLNVEEDCRTLRIAEAILERLEKNEYTEKDWNSHMSLYPSRLFTAEHRETMKGEREDVQRMVNKERYMQKQDFEYLAKHLNKHLHSWWD